MITPAIRSVDRCNTYNWVYRTQLLTEVNHQVVVGYQWDMAILMEIFIAHTEARVWDGLN